MREPIATSTWEGVQTGQLYHLNDPHSDAYKGCCHKADICQESLVF